MTRSIELWTGHLLTFRHHYDDRGKIDDFALVLRLADGTEIARLDTCHAELHTHYYGLDGRLPEVRSVREVLPADPIAKADRLHAIYVECYEDMLRTAEGRAP